MASKILLVEDDNNLREIYEARLMAEGYTIVTAKDGEEALVVAKAEKPNLVISDVMMPRISGFEMLDILRNTEDLRDTKVIMLTALGQADDKTRANSLGADRYLVKSQVTLEDIVKAAHELIGDEAPAATSSPALAPVAPAAPAPAAPSPAAMPTAPVPPAPAATPQASQDDAVLANAMNDLAASAAPVAPAAPAPAAPSPAAMPAPEPPTAAPAPEPPMPAAPSSMPEPSMPAPAPEPLAPTPAPMPEPPTPTPQPEPAAEPEQSATPVLTGSVPIANKKVIQPLSSEPKQNINALLAKEEARDMAPPMPAPPAPVPETPSPMSSGGPSLNPDMLNMPTGPAPQAGHVVGPSAPQAPQPPTNPSDPNNIAL